MPKIIIPNAANAKIIYNDSSIGPFTSVDVVWELFTVQLTGLSSGVAQIGTTISAQVEWPDVPGTITSYEFTVNGVTVQDTASADYLVDAAGDEEFLRVIAHSAADGDATSAPAVIRHAKPVASGSIPTQTLTHTAAEQTIVADVSTLFTGSNMTFSVTGYVGARIDGTALKIDPSSAVGNQTVTLTATNSGGPTDIPFTLNVVALAFTSATFSGTGKVDATHTTTATVNLAGASFSYTYERDGVPIAGAADQDTYVAVAADDETQLGPLIEATVDGVTISTRPATIYITRVAPTQNTAPTASGDAVIGESLTGVAGTFNGGDVAVSSEWETSDNGSTGWAGTADTDLSSPPQASGKYYSYATTGSNSGGSLKIRSNIIGPAIAPTISFVGLTDGNAVEGDHGTISLATNIGTITATKFGSTSGGSQYGTGANPDDFTGGTTLFGTATVGGIDYTISAPIVEGVGTIPTTTTNFIDAGDGVTFTFANDVEVFQYEDGSWGIVSTDDVILTASTPASVADPVDGYISHGLMDKGDINPIDDYSADQTWRFTKQGWDEMVGQDDTVNVKGTYTTEYDAALNKDPSKVGGSPLTVALQGQSGGFVKVKRRSTIATGSGGLYETGAMFEKIVHINVVPTAPLVGAIRPPIIGTDPQLNINDADFTRVRTFNAPASLAVWKPLADCKYYVSRPQLMNVVEGERRNALCDGGANLNFYAGTTFPSLVSPAATWMLAADTPAQDRQDLLAAFMVKAVDSHGAWDAGLRPTPGAGQHAVDQFAQSLIVALVPGNAALAASNAGRTSNLNDCALWPNSADEGQTGEFLASATKTGPGVHNHQPLLPEQFGYPMWVVGSASKETNPPYRLNDGSNTDAIARYRPIIYQMSIMGLVPLGEIEGGLEALYGAQATWNTSNQRYAMLPWTDNEYLLTGTKIRPGSDTPDFIAELYEAHRATMPYNGTPEPILPQPPVQAVGNMTTKVMDTDYGGLASFEIFTTTASGVDYDFRKFSRNDTDDWTGSRTALTKRQVSLSHDGVQWGDPIAVTTTGSIPFTGERWLRYQTGNSEGDAPWTVNYPQQGGRELLTDGSVPNQLRNIVTGGAIPVGAPSNVTPPGLYKYRYEENLGDQPGYWLYDTQDATMATGQTKLIAGVGIWSNGATFSLKWQVSANLEAPTYLTGETDQVYERKAEVISTATISRRVRCEVTADDGNGNTTVLYTPYTTMPEAVTISDDFTTEPDYIIGTRTGTYEYRLADGVVRVIPNPAEAFSGAAVRLTGLIIGKTYDFTVAISDRNTQAGSIDARVTSDMVYSEANDWWYGAGAPLTTTTELAGTGNMTLQATAVASVMYFDVRFRGAAAVGSWIDVTSVTAVPVNAEVPAAMSAPTVTANAVGGVNVSTSEVPDDGGDTIIRYEMSYQTDGGAYSSPATVTHPINEDITGLGNGVLTGVRVRAVNSISANPSNWSPNGTATTWNVPGTRAAPAVVAVGSDTIRVTLDATAPAANGSAITSQDMRWQEDGGAWTTITGFTSPYDVTGRTASTLHNAQTRDVNEVGAGAWSASGSATTEAPSNIVFFDDFSSAPTIGTDLGSTTEYIDMNSSSTYNAGPEMITVQQTSAFGGLLSPAITIEASHTYLIEVNVTNNLAASKKVLIDTDKDTGGGGDDGPGLGSADGAPAGGATTTISFNINTADAFWIGATVLRVKVLGDGAATSGTFDYNWIRVTDTT